MALLNCDAHHIHGSTEFARTPITEVSGGGAPDQHRRVINACDDGECRASEDASAPQANVDVGDYDALRVGRRGGHGGDADLCDCGHADGVSVRGCEHARADPETAGLGR